MVPIVSGRRVVCRRLSVLLVAVGVLLCGRPALADRLPGPTQMETTPVQVEVKSAPLKLVTLRAAPVVNESDEIPEPFVGPGPWALFDKPLPGDRCESARLSQAATVILAVCAGGDHRYPRLEHVVLRRGEEVLRYPFAIHRRDGAVAVSLSSDGSRFAVRVEGRSGPKIHLVDLEASTISEISGPWSSPGTLRVADGADAVAFEAYLGEEQHVVVVSLEDETVARRVWPKPGAVLYDLAGDGRGVLVTHETNDGDELFLVDVSRNTRFELSGRRGDVQGAALHAGGMQAVFTSRVGGVCALWWTDLVTRQRKDFMATIDHCLGMVDVDAERRFVLSEEIDGGSRQFFIWDRKSRKPYFRLPSACQQATLSGMGRFVAARCEGDGPSGLRVFRVPEKATVQ
ncbi:MAG: hypothetical protein CL928_09805 [Deltaproteobacteria bacterium]|nr:hypothetical protein [Deltaproteobacteria bacterium]